MIGFKILPVIRYPLTHTQHQLLDTNIAYSTDPSVVDFIQYQCNLDGILDEDGFPFTLSTASGAFPTLKAGFDTTIITQTQKLAPESFVAPGEDMATNFYLKYLYVLGLEPIQFMRQINMLIVREVLEETVSAIVYGKTFYYFVEDMKQVNGSIFEYTLALDVFKTYWSDIKEFRHLRPTRYYPKRSEYFRFDTRTDADYIDPLVDIPSQATVKYPLAHYVKQHKQYESRDAYRYSGTWLYLYFSFASTDTMAQIRTVQFMDSNYYIIAYPKYPYDNVNINAANGWPVNKTTLNILLRSPYLIKVVESDIPPFNNNLEWSTDLVGDEFEVYAEWDGSTLRSNLDQVVKFKNNTTVTNGFIYEQDGTGLPFLGFVADTTLASLPASLEAQFSASGPYSTTPSGLLLFVRDLNPNVWRRDNELYPFNPTPNDPGLDSYPTLEELRSRVPLDYDLGLLEHGETYMKANLSGHDERRQFNATRSPKAIGYHYSDKLPINSKMCNYSEAEEIERKLQYACSTSPSLLTLEDLFAMQLVTKGDFSNGTTGWITVNIGTPTVTNGIVTFTATAINGILYQDISSVLNDKYYAITRIKASSNLVLLRFMNTNTFISISTDWQLVSTIRLGVGVVSGVGVRDARSSGWSPIEVDYIYAFNLQPLIDDKIYSPMYATTFDLMTDAQIKAQMDYWISLYQKAIANEDDEAFRPYTMKKLYFTSFIEHSLVDSVEKITYAHPKNDEFQQDVFVKRANQIAGSQVKDDYYNYVYLNQNAIQQRQRELAVQPWITSGSALISLAGVALAPVTGGASAALAIGAASTGYNAIRNLYSDFQQQRVYKSMLDDKKLGPVRVDPGNFNQNMLVLNYMPILEIFYPRHNVTTNYQDYTNDDEWDSARLLDVHERYGYYTPNANFDSNIEKFKHALTREHYNFVQLDDVSGIINDAYIPNTHFKLILDVLKGGVMIMTPDYISTPDTIDNKEREGI